MLSNLINSAVVTYDLSVREDVCVLNGVPALIRRGVLGSFMAWTYGTEARVHLDYRPCRAKPDSFTSVTKSMSSVFILR